MTDPALSIPGLCRCADGCIFGVLTKSDVVQAALRDKLLQDHSVLAAFLTGLRMYLEDPTKVSRLTFAALFNGVEAQSRLIIISITV